MKYALRKDGKTQKFQTAVLVRGNISDELTLTSDHDWVTEELRLFAGNLLGCVVHVPRHSPLFVLSVYSPAWPILKNRLSGTDVSAVKLKHNPDVWCTELLWSGLSHMLQKQNQQWIVGGDLNSSETFDDLSKSGPRGNKEILDRMKGLGMTECLRFHNGQLTPTFKNPRDGEIIHQLDHLFVSENLLPSLSTCITGEPSLIFGDSLSDHLPIIADFIP